MSVAVLLLQILASLTYVFIIASYFLGLNRKWAEVKRLLEGKRLQEYLDSYAGGLRPEELFSYYHSPEGFFLPILLNAVTVFAVATATLHPGPNAGGLSVSFTSPALAGFLGAYLWSHFDALRRYATIDLNPSFIYMIWFRFVAGGALGFLIGVTTKEPVDLLLAFAIGAVPIDGVRGWLKKYAGDKLVGDQAKPAEAPTLQRIEGATEEIIERLSEEGISSTQHLALANPVRLMMRTNIEWLVLLDLMDQALLDIYATGKTDKLRGICIRGCIEVAEIGSLLNEPESQSEGEARIAAMAVRLEFSEPEMRRFVDTITGDPQVTFIWKLWSEAVGEKDD